ncbi:unnamed protein product [Pieris brassicae]|uniref:Uncharacterized protein n=1 Tax=Pieris brassicae TaxID=7116 RepID=A0A9P0TI31_PIEBR|nr:unnamed protein product [Pieris brassicae]
MRSLDAVNVSLVFSQNSTVTAKRLRIPKTIRPRIRPIRPNERNGPTSPARPIGYRRVHPEMCIMCIALRVWGGGGGALDGRRRRRRLDTKGLQMYRELGISLNF